MVNTEIVDSSLPTVSTPINPPVVENNLTVPPVLNRHPKIISILLLLLIGALLYRTIASIVVIAILVNSVVQSFGLVSIFSLAPFFCIFPAIAAIMVVFLIYLFLKTRDLSAVSYKLILVSLIIISLLYSLLVYLSLSQADSIYSATSINSNSISSNLVSTILSAIINEINFFSVIILMIVKKKKDYFINPSISLSVVQKIIIIVLGLVILFPAFSQTFTAIRYSLYPDTKYDTIRSKVGHKIYKPNFLPQGLEIISQYYIDDKNTLNLQNPTVKVAYDVPINKKSIDSPSEIIILNQSLIVDDFNLVDYLSKQHPAILPQQVELSTAINNVGYLLTPTLNANSKMETKSLYFITPDNILVNLVSVSSRIKSQDLINMANSIN